MDKATSVIEQSEFKDDKTIITDVAFGVNQRLLGIKLATPLQRGVAMLVDAFFVLFLTDASGLFWGAFVGIAFFKAGAKKANARWRILRWWLRLLGAITIFVCTLLLVESGINQYGQEQDGNGSKGNVVIKPSNVDALANTLLFGKEAYNVTQKINNDPTCDRSCLDKQIHKLLTKAAKLNISQAEVAEMLREFLTDVNYQNEQERQTHLADLIKYYEQLQPDPEQIESEANAVSPPKIVKTVDLAEQNTTSGFSFIDYVKGIIADLGLGFGWAALYFTAFSAWWRGQTPGKKLMRIRVVQLDGSYMSAWDSFGRYGGYGAGFATGLLGFLQIFWDPNRQAIQDKISATVVIKGDLPDNSR